MNGPEHYTAAEEMVENVVAGLLAASPSTLPELEESAVVLLAVAQVHATLALAAATAATHWTGPQEANGGHSTTPLWDEVAP